MTTSVDQFEADLEKTIEPKHINRLKFSDDGEEYEFNIAQLKNIEIVKTTARHTIYRYLHSESQTEFVAKSFRIPTRRYGDQAKNAKKEKESFLREIEIFITVSPNPYIISFYGICIHDGQALICMECMALSLYDLYLYVHERGELFPENIVGYIAISTVNALAWCNKKKIMHRDVKPGNILVNSKGEIKLGDFGISKITDEDTASTVVGTMAYWPPEKFKYTPTYDSSTDVWSLGITLLEILCGKIPYTDNDGVVPNNFLTLQLCIEKTLETNINGIVERCFRIYEETNIDMEHVREFVNTCLLYNNEHSKRPKYKDLKHEKLYKKFAKEIKQNMDNEVAAFLGKYKDIGLKNSRIEPNKNDLDKRDFKLNSSAESKSRIYDDSPSPEIQEMNEEIIKQQEYIKSLEMELKRVKNEKIKKYSTQKLKVSVQLQESGTRNSAAEAKNLAEKLAKFRMESNLESHNDLTQILLDNPHVNINKLEFSPSEQYAFDYNDLEYMETLGANTKSVVKRYIHRPSNYELAIKFVNIPYSKNTQREAKRKTYKHILREIENSLKLRHAKNIVYYYGYCLYQEQILFCMELMDLSLKEVYLIIKAKNHTISEDLIGCIVVAVVDALVECHENNVVHRNIETNNIFVKRPDKIKIGDFNESAILGIIWTTLTFGGHLMYLPPETFDVSKCNLDIKKTDVWAFGISILEIVYGKLPYQTENEALSSNITVLEQMIKDFQPNEFVDKIFANYSKDCLDFVKCCLLPFEDRPSFHLLENSNFYKNYQNANVSSILKLSDIF